MNVQFTTRVGIARLVYVPALVLGAVLAPLSWGETPFTPAAAKPNFSSVQTLIEHKITEDRIPSVTVAVARRGNVLWERGFGWANRERVVAASAHSMYALASVTKLMTGTAIMMLRDRGQIDLDGPVNDYLGPGKLTSPFWNPAGATVRRVATHTAGLATYDNGYA